MEVRASYFTPIWPPDSTPRSEKVRILTQAGCERTSGDDVFLVGYEIRP